MNRTLRLHIDLLTAWDDYSPPLKKQMLLMLLICKSSGPVSAYVDACGQMIKKSILPANQLPVSNSKVLKVFKKEVDLPSSVFYISIIECALVCV